MNTEEPSTSQADSGGGEWRPLAKSARLAEASEADSSSLPPKAEGKAFSPKAFQKDPTKFHVLLGVTGSVAAIKVTELVSELNRQSPQNRLLLRIVTTESGAKFFDTESFPFPVYRDADEWGAWKGIGDPVLHIELRKWADLLVVAPLDANTLGKVAGGLCDNLLTCLIRAWDPAKPLHFAPAMNTYMLEHPLTFKHLELLKNLLNYKEIPSVSKTLACGDTGLGAMAPAQMIASVVAGEIRKKFALVSG